MTMSQSLMDRGERAFAWLTEKGRWIYNRPWAMVVVLALFGLGIRHAWLSPQPLSAGDWHWPDNPVLANYSPWPSVWDSSLGLGGENRFSAVFRFPIYAITGLFAVLGAGVLLLLLLSTSWRLSRPKALLLLVAYAGYAAWLAWQQGLLPHALLGLS